VFNYGYVAPTTCKTTPPPFERQLNLGECELAITTQGVACQNDHPSHIIIHLLPILHTLVLTRGMRLQPSSTFPPHPYTPLKQSQMK